jgi:hypothetical protein
MSTTVYNTEVGEKTIDGEQIIPYHGSVKMTATKFPAHYQTVQENKL